MGIATRVLACTVFAGLAAVSGCRWDGGGTKSPPTYTIGGTVSGLVGSLALTNNGGDTLTVSANGPFTFATASKDASTYSVAVSSQPAGQTCAVANGSGTVAGAKVTNVTVTCTQVYTVGGSVTGLRGSLTLANGSNTVTLTADGAFTLPGSLASGATYAVSITAQPANQQCTLANASGTVAAANVTNVAVTCTTFRVTADVGPSGGTVTGPDGVQVVIPAGALAQTVTVGIARNPSGWPTPLVPDATPLGPIYEFTPHGTIFKAPVLIRFPVSAPPTGLAAFASSFDTGWHYTDVTLNGGFAEFERSSFSWYYLYAPGIPCNANGQPAACVFPSGHAYATATPGTAMTLTSGTAQGLALPPNGAVGSAGTWAVTDGALSTIQLTMKYTAAGDCASGHVSLLKANPPSAPIVITDQSGQTAGGAGSVTLSYTPADLRLTTGTNLYLYRYACARPGQTEAGGGDWIAFDVRPTPVSGVTIGGTVTNLLGAGLILRNALRDEIGIAPGATSFQIPTPQVAGLPFDIRIVRQPAGQTCTVARGTGIASANVTDVNVTCTGTPTAGGLVLTANSASNSVTSFRRDDASGVLTSIGSVSTGSAGPFRIVLSPDGRFAYVTHSSGNSVGAFTVDRVGGTLTPIPQGSATVTNPFGIAMDPGGRFVWVASRSANRVVTLAIDPVTGALSPAGAPLPTRNTPYGVAVHPSGTFLYVTHETDNSVSAFRVDAAGQLVLVGSLPNALLQPHGITVDPSGRFAYVAEIQDRAIAAFRIDASTGALTPNGFSSLGQGFGEAVVAHPNGKFLYASDRKSPGGVFVFGINQTTGVLTQLGPEVQTGGDLCGAIAMNAAGTLLYVTNSGSNTVSTFTVDPVSGAIVRVGTPSSTGTTPEGVAATP